MSRIYYSEFYPATGDGILGTTIPSPSPSLITPVSITFTASSTGVLNTGQLPLDVSAVRKSGGTDVSDETTWSIITSGCTASIATDGTITITDVTSSGSITVTSAYKGVTLVNIITVNKTFGDAPSSSPSASTTIVPSTNTTTYSGYSGTILTITADASGSATVSASLGIVVSTSAIGTYESYGKVQYRAVGSSTWIDVGTEVLNNYGADVYREDVGYQ